MIRISKPIKQLREEFDEGEDGELLLTLRQQLNQDEVRQKVGGILDEIERRRYPKIAKGCCNEMKKILETARDEAS